MAVLEQLVLALPQGAKECFAVDGFDAAALDVVVAASSISRTSATSARYPARASLIGLKLCLSRRFETSPQEPVPNHPTYHAK